MPTGLHTAMEFLSFKEYGARRDEGLLLPDRPPLKGMVKINPFPTTDTHRKRLHTMPPKIVRPFAPTVRNVA